MLDLVFPPGTKLIIPLPDNHVKRSNSRISTFHLDEVGLFSRASKNSLDSVSATACLRAARSPRQVPGKSVDEAKHLLVNVS